MKVTSLSCSFDLSGRIGASDIFSREDPIRKGNIFLNDGQPVVQTLLQHSQPWDQLPLSFDIFVSLISVGRKSNLLNISTVQLYHDIITVVRPRWLRKPVETLPKSKVIALQKLFLATHYITVGTHLSWNTTVLVSRQGLRFALWILTTLYSLV